MTAFPLPSSKAGLVDLLTATGTDADALYAAADVKRREVFGDAVPVRAIIEFSNLCGNDCFYCGIRAGNSDVVRYRMSVEDILHTVHLIHDNGMAGTVVLQAGEQPGYSDRDITHLLERLKNGWPDMAVTLSIGNRPRQVYADWKAAGLDRYLLRFETADPAKFRQLHPACTLDERLQCLVDLKALDIQTGSGFMVGLPGDTPESVADNILLCQSLELDMIGIGPYIPSTGTPMAGEANAFQHAPDMFYKTLAALRLACPQTHIPATTAFDAAFPDGRRNALARGANVLMPNATPAAYRRHYQLYPGKPGMEEDTLSSLQWARDLLAEIERPVADGPSHAIRKTP